MKKLLGTTICLIGIVLTIVGSLYLVRQGAFDSPSVRMIRMATSNDSVSVNVAKLIHQHGVTESAKAGILDIAGEEFDINADSANVTLVSFLISRHIATSYSPRHAYFDWKAHSLEVVPAFNAMLDFYDIDERPDLSLLAIHEQKFGPTHSNFPINLGHYLPIFERNGLTLMLLDVGWDSYYVFVTNSSTAEAWDNVKIGDPEDKVRLNISKLSAPTKLPEINMSDRELDMIFDSVMLATANEKLSPKLANISLTDTFKFW